MQHAIVVAPYRIPVDLSHPRQLGLDLVGHDDAGFLLRVDLLNEEDDTEITYQIVGEDEADIREGRVSFTSPIARALISREEGDSVTFNAPGGEKTYEILEVRYE